MRWFFLVFLMGCAAEGGGFGAGERDDDDSAEPVGEPFACPEGGCSVGSVEQVDASELEPPCVDVLDCMTEYLAFIDAAEGLGEPVDLADLEDELAWLLDGGGEAQEGPISAEDLADELRGALGTAFLFDGVEQVQTRVALVETRTEAGWIEEHWLVEDPWIGTLQMVMLRPLTSRPFRGVVGGPGHSEQWFDHRDLRLGLDLIEARAAVLIVEPRVHDGNEDETYITRELLAAGFSFLGLRIYEKQLARKVLRWHEDVHPGIVAIQGHSGGSTTANVAVRVDAGWAALITDLTTDYLNASVGGPWFDETCFGVHLQHPRVNDFSTLPVPHWEDSYGYPAGASGAVAVLRGLDP